MADKPITLRITSDKVSTIDAIAKLHERDRSYVINAAIDNYLDLQAELHKLIESRVSALSKSTSKLVDHSEVVKKMGRTRRMAARKKVRA